jgi:futalosine hydrolase
MRILLVAATFLEIKPFLEKIGHYQNNIIKNLNIKYNNIEIEILISGIGLVFTTFHLANALNDKKYDLVINAGIAGSFNRELKIGEIVIVNQEEFCDLGIENPESFQTLFESGFLNKEELPFIDGKLRNNINENLKDFSLKFVKGISSNTAHGNESRIKDLEAKYNPDIETMEGAAFFYTCLMSKVKFIEIRAISNYVEARNVQKWNVPLAIENLSKELLQIIHAFNN